MFLKRVDVLGAYWATMQKRIEDKLAAGEITLAEARGAVWNTGIGISYRASRAPFN